MWCVVGIKVILDRLDPELVTGFLGESGDGDGSRGSIEYVDGVKQIVLALVNHLIPVCEIA
jgi:hypothetical protein